MPSADEQAAQDTHDAIARILAQWRHGLGPSESLAGKRGAGPAAHPHPVELAADPHGGLAPGHRLAAVKEAVAWSQAIDGAQGAEGKFLRARREARAARRALDGPAARAVGPTAG